jgi:tetratricopeptide (TPR) repeat protein
MEEKEYGRGSLSGELEEEFKRAEIQSRFAERDGDYATALGHVERALEILPSHVPCRIRMGSLHNRMGHPEEARLIYEDLAGVLPQDALLLNNLGAVHFDLGEYESATGFYKRSIEADPGSYLPYANLAYAYAVLGTAQLALLYAEKLVGLVAYGRYVPFARVARCRAFLANDLKEKAVETLSNAGIEEEKNLLFNLHRLYFAEDLGIRDKGRLVEMCTRLARAAVDRSHEPHKAFYRLTLVDLMAGREPAALEAAREAVRRGPFKGILEFAGLYYLEFLGIPESHAVFRLWREKADSVSGAASGAPA